MKIFNKTQDMQSYALAAKHKNLKIAIVPTMGFLHDGHLSLIRRAREVAEVVIVSIFVNPTQFGPNEDLDKYPRDFEHDCALCEAEGVNAVFAPDPGEMYAPNYSVWVNETDLSTKLCGLTRPIHFRGVCTVVAKLFNISQADVAIFGQKDAQQALIIQRMVRDLNFPIEIIVSELIRDKDNLALSSRNRYLSSDERQRALSISKSLFAAEKEIKLHGTSVALNCAENIKNTIAQAGGKIDYVEAYDADSLTAPTADTTRLLLAVAAYFGKSRLIDNILLKVNSAAKPEV